MALAREITALEEIDEREAERVWQVAKRISEGKSARQICDRWGKHTELEGGRDLSGQPLVMISVFQIGKIITRVTDRLSRGNLACPPGANPEIIDEIIQKYKNSEQLQEALFANTAAACDKAFRYGYYAALEDEAD